ncbi:MAG: ADP-heptose:LPS heptosyltransferase [Flavobacteriales bacterium]|jgi:ADP-heptose:LPS heptosyltransferase
MAKYLILRFSSIGDIVLTTPVVRCLKKQKDAEIHFFTKKPFVGMLEANPHVDKVFALEGDLKKQIKQLCLENYDGIIDLHHNLRTLRIKRGLQCGSWSFDKLNIQKWLLTRIGINKMPDVHIVDRYLDTVKSLGVKNDLAGLDFFIPKKDALHLEEVLPLGFLNYVGFVIGGQHATKMLPQDKIETICKGISSPIVLLGGPDDAERGESIANAIGLEKVFNACGKFNLNQSAYLVKEAQSIVTHDTGLMHIASALKKRIISVWGNTVPEFGMSPYLPAKGSKQFEVKGLNCRPCSKIGYAKCPKGHFKCMKMQDVEAITKSI